MSDRRRHHREHLNIAVDISTTERRSRIGVTRDVSESGMLFQSLSRFAVGDRVELVYRVRDHDETIVGRVVRATRDPSWSLYPNGTAVRFDGTEG